MNPIYSNNIKPKGWKNLRKCCGQNIKLCTQRKTLYKAKIKNSVTLWYVELSNKWYLVSNNQPCLKCHSKNESPSICDWQQHMLMGISTMHYFGNPGHTQDFDRVFLVILVINCIVGNLLTGPIICSFHFCIVEVNVNVIVSKLFLSFQQSTVILLRV